MKFARWVAEVDKLLKSDFCLSIADAGFEADWLRKMWNGGDTPEEFVAWVSEKYDLTPRREWEAYLLR